MTSSAADLASVQWFATLAKVALSANALLRDTQGRVALCRNTYRDGWSLPGGVVEDNEPPALACNRELAEELGFEAARPGRLIAIQWAPRAPETALQFLSLTFDVGVCADPSALRIQEEEIAEVGFFALDALPDGTRPFMRNRLQAIRDAAPGSVVYLEERVH
jgi:8-oxo-dGTP diphosphatase